MATRPQYPLVRANNQEATPGDEIEAFGVMVWNNSNETWHRQRGAGSAVDGVAYQDAAIVGIARYNNTNWERWRDNYNVALLSLAARTATTSSAAQVNYNSCGIVIAVRVTVLGAGSTLVPVVQVTLGGGGNQTFLTLPAIAATGTYFYILWPGAVETIATANLEVQGLPLVRDWRLQVQHTNVESCTYEASAGYVVTS